MTTLTINISNKKTEKAIKAILDAFGLDYNVNKYSEECPLNISEQAIYDRLKKTAEDIKLYKEGKVKFQDATKFLNEL